MARLCRLTWAGGTRSCTLPYAHPENCADGPTVRRIASLVAIQRFEERVLAEAARVGHQPVQALTPPEVAADDDDGDLVAEAPAPVIEAPAPPPPDLVTDPRAFLNAHYGVTVDWRIVQRNDRWKLVDERHELVLPFVYAQKLQTCCGVLNIGQWYGPFDAVSRAAFHLYVRLVREGNIATMCIMSTTKYSQTDAINLLREAGFVETPGYNRNSGNMMSVWILRLYPERP